MSFNPATTTVTSIDGRWKIVDGSHWIFDFGSNRAEAEQSLQIIKKHDFTRSCFVGRPDPSFEYLRKSEKEIPVWGGESLLKYLTVDGDGVTAKNAFTTSSVEVFSETLGPTNHRVKRSRE